ncbi:MAG: NADH-quinone oxidoreductase subunit M [Proteobacteria bacterium]|nr:NADH-quinone oxidoreductase subunit M [Pseudomonadota bacterium]
MLTFIATYYAFWQPYFLSLLVFLPLLAAVITLAVPQRVSKWVALVLSLAPLKVAVATLFFFNPAQPGLQFAELHPWLPAFNIFYSLGADGISLPLIALNCLLTPLCILASWNLGAAQTNHESRITNHARPNAFFASFLALQGAVNGVFVAQDFILFYLFWEAMLIPMFLIIGLWGGENRVYAALKFFLYTFVGSVLMLIAGLWMFTHTGTFSLPVWSTTHFPIAAQSLLFLAFFAAFAVKVPMWPFHTWLPDAHVQAPTAGSVILAGILLKMGAYGFLRFSLPMFPEAAHTFAPFIFTLSAIAVVYAALVAYVQTDVKKLIAYSSVSHMGMVTLGIFAMTPESLHGALLVMLNHGIVSAGLFLAVGVIYDRLHTRELAKFGGLVQIMPAYAFAVMFLTLAAVALPGTNSFVGEFLALAGSFPSAPVYTAIATTGVIFGALYMLHLYRGMLFGTPSTFVEEHKSHLPDMSFREWLVFIPLLALIPILGLMPSLAMNLWAQPVQILATPPITHNPQPATLLPEEGQGPEVSPTTITSATEVPAQ